MEVGVVEVVEVVEGDIDIVDLVEAPTPVVEEVSEIVLEQISRSFVQRQKRIAIYHVKKFVKDSQL